MHGLDLDQPLRERCRHLSRRRHGLLRLVVRCLELLVKHLLELEQFRMGEGT